METTVPCGIYTIIPGTKGESVACGGTCYIDPSLITVNGPDMVTGLKEVGPDEIVSYICDRCGHRTSRYGSGKPLPAWDGILRDGSNYYDAAPDENDWRL